VLAEYGAPALRLIPVIGREAVIAFLYVVLNAFPAFIPSFARRFG
jgi:hypothetical protein